MSDLWTPPAGLVIPQSERLDEFHVIAGTLITQQKTPLVIEPFQDVCLAPHFAGAKLTTIIQPKKLGKSTIVAAVAIHHALTVDDCDVIIVAVSKTQAKIIYRHIWGFIRRSTGSKQLDLNDHLEVKDGFSEIRCKRDLGRIRVLAADDATLEGVEPTLFLVDEYGQHKTSAAYDPLNDGIDTRDGQGIIISNAGNDEEGPLGVKRAEMLKHAVAHEDAFTFCRTPDGSEVLVEFALDLSIHDPENLDDVKLANPASWMTKERLARRLATRATVSRWLRMACGVWVRGDEAAIKPWEWDELVSDLRIPQGADVIIGVDLAFSGGQGDVPTDATALVPHHWTTQDPKTARRIIGDPIILEPPSGDGRLDDRAVDWALAVMAGWSKFDRDLFELELAEDNDPADVEAWADAIEACPGYRARTIVYDPNAGAEQMMQKARRAHRDVTFAEFEQKASAMARADARFMEALRNKQLTHSGHAGLRRHVLDAVEKSVGEAFYFDHSKRPRKQNDSLRAGSMAHDAAVAQGGTGRVRKGARIHFA